MNDPGTRYDLIAASDESTVVAEFAGNEVVTPRELQDYQSIYLNLYAEFRGATAVEREAINDDLIFEIDNAFRDGSIPSTGTAIMNILPPVSRFSAEAGHATKKRTVLDRLTTFFERYFGLTGSDPTG